MNSIFSFYNYIADYKNRSGEDFHNEFQIPKSAVKDETDGAKQIKAFLIGKGYTPEIIVSVKGNYTLEELQQLAAGELYSRQTLIDSLKQSPIQFM